MKLFAEKTAVHPSRSGSLSGALSAALLVISGVVAPAMAGEFPVPSFVEQHALGADTSAANRQSSDRQSTTPRPAFTQAAADDPADSAAPARKPQAAALPESLMFAASSLLQKSSRVLVDNFDGNRWKAPASDDWQVSVDLHKTGTPAAVNRWAVVRYTRAIW